MTWHEAQARYGTDKPDVRFGLELVDVGEVLEATEFRAFQAEAVKGIKVARGGRARTGPARCAHGSGQGSRRCRARVDARADVRECHRLTSREVPFGSRTARAHRRAAARSPAT